MKFSEFKEAIRANHSVSNQPPPLTHVFVPAARGTTKYNLETLDLVVGICPECGAPVSPHGTPEGTFFECSLRHYHYYFRDLSIPGVDPS